MKNAVVRFYNISFFLNKSAGISALGAGCGQLLLLLIQL